MTGLYRTSTRPLPYVQDDRVVEPENSDIDDVGIAGNVIGAIRVTGRNRFDAYERILGLSAEVHRLEPFEARYNSLLAGIKGLHAEMANDTDTPAEEWHSDVLNTLSEWITGEAVNARLRPTTVNQELLYHLKQVLLLPPLGTGTTTAEAGKQQILADAKRYVESL